MANHSEFRLLYPASPLRFSLPDETYAEECTAAIDAGFTVFLSSYEDLLAGNFRSRPQLSTGAPILYRGWMLTPDKYHELQASIVRCGAEMLTSPTQYERCHHLPKWYPLLRDFTPETRFFQESDDLISELRALSWTGCFLKDHVKSLALEGGSLVTDLEQIPGVIAKMKAYRSGIEGGLCARRLESFVPDSEERFFVFRGRAFGRQDFVPEIVAAAARRIDSPFFSVDTILRSDGITRIVEIGDGQVSDRKQWTVGQFLNILRVG